VAHLRFGGVVSRLDRGSARVPALRTPADVLKRLGRVVLWLLVVVLLLRGLASLFGSDTPAPASLKPAATAVAVWPDDEARAFASDFARAYLGYSSPTDLDRFVSPQLVGSIEPDVARDAKSASIASVSVARTAKLDSSHALVTVAAAVEFPRFAGQGWAFGF
jgi:hypothetical protein